MLSKPVYESLPYVYLAVGYGLITYQPSFFASISGCLFFIAGALVWSLRSHFRRSDAKMTRHDNENNKAIQWYELKPFLLFLVAIMVMTWVDGKIVMLLAVVLMLIASWIMFLRINNRYTNSRPHSSKHFHK